MNQIIKFQEIKITPAVIQFDFESAKALVEAHLERFDGVVITDESVKEGKELIKEINSTKKMLSELRKTEVKKASEPIKIFDEQIKELEFLHEQAKQKFQVIISNYENEQKELIRLALIDLQATEWLASNVRAEFQKSQVDHLVLLGSFTAGGKLTSKAKAEVSLLVGNDLAVQQQTDLRLSQLESMCYKAGLAAPLNNGHVQHFLFDDEVSYQTKLNALLASELQREEQAILHRKAQEHKAHMLAEQERNAKAQAEAEAEAVQRQQEIEAQNNTNAQQNNYIQPQPEPQYQPQEVANTYIPPTNNNQASMRVQNEFADNKSKVRIIIEFDTVAGVDIPNDKIANSLDAKLKAAGFSTHRITSVTRY